MYMKKKIFSLLVLLMAAVTGAWADIIPTYDLSVGTNDHSTMKFYVGQDEVTKAKEGETVTIVVTPDEPPWQRLPAVQPASACCRMWT